MYMSCTAERRTYDDSCPNFNRLVHLCLRVGGSAFEEAWPDYRHQEADQHRHDHSDYRAEQGTGVQLARELDRSCLRIMRKVSEQT